LATALVMHARSSTESSCGKDANVVDTSSMTAMIDVLMMILRQQLNRHSI
jgi:hypothetical protein